MNLLLIDGDIVAYRCAASIEPTKLKPDREDVELAIRRADELLYRICDTLKIDKYRVFLSGPENFRKLIYPDYKANRRDKPEPAELQNVRYFLASEWGATVCDGYEADDGISMHSTQDTIVCSTDKDLQQISGTHFNFVKSEITVVDERTAILNLFTQMLVGDSSDNLPGIRGIGPVKALRILGDLPTEEMGPTVLSYYESEREFFRNYLLFKLLEDEADYHRRLQYASENCIGQSEGEEVTRDCSGQDSGTLSGVNPQ